jgi:hypothetical protein
MTRLSEVSLPSGTNPRLLGRTDEAERALLSVRAGFLDRKLGYDAALVSLDLAMLYLRQSRTAELKELAEQMHPVFEAEDIHREALAALLTTRNFPWEIHGSHPVGSDQISTVCLCQPSRRDKGT